MKSYFRASLPHILLILLGVVAVEPIAVAAPKGSLFTAAPSPAVRSVGPGAGLRARFVVVDPGAAETARRSRGEWVVSIPLFDGLVAHAVLQRDELATETGATWSGYLLEDASGSVLLSVVGEQVVGRVWTASAEYRIEFAGDGQHRLVETDLRTQPEELAPLRVELPKVGRRSAAAQNAVGESGIDVLVGYTPEALAGAGNRSAMQAEVANMVAWANYSLRNSGISGRIRTVGVIPVEGTEIQDDLYASLEQLRGGAGPMYLLDLERSSRGADVVILVQESGNGCGLSYLMESPSASFSAYAFGVVRRACTTSFTHEIGHLLGGQHDRESASSGGAYSYSHGWASPESGTRTTMAVNTPCSAQGTNCTRVPYWSDPAMRYSGHALGDDAANNAQTLQATWATAANFRAEVSKLEPVSDLKLVRRGKKIVVRWKQSESATSYTILRTEGIEESVVIGTKGRAGTRFVDRSIGTQRGNYCYQVLASDGEAQAIAAPVCMDR